MDENQFENFIEDAYGIWVKEKEELLQEALLEELLKEATEMSTVEIGNEGEAYVRGLIDESGYITGMPPRSRTPADVWGFYFNAEKKLVHLPLIQVKTAVFPRTPKELSEGKVKELEIFAKFINDLFDRSRHTKNYRGCHRIVSFGYAGVLLSTLEPILLPNKQVTQSCGFKFFHTDSLKPYLKSIADEVRNFYKFENGR